MHHGPQELEDALNAGPETTIAVGDKSFKISKSMVKEFRRFQKKEFGACSVNIYYFGRSGWRRSQVHSKRD